MENKRSDRYGIHSQEEEPTLSLTLVQRPVRYTRPTLGTFIPLLEFRQF